MTFTVGDGFHRFTKESTVVILDDMIAYKARVESKIILGNIGYS